PAPPSTLSLHDALPISGTVLATTGPYYGAGDFGQVGVRAGLELDTRDHTAAPARGVHLSMVGQGYPAVWDAVHPFGSVSAEASTDRKSTRLNSSHVSIS